MTTNKNIIIFTDPGDEISHKAARPTLEGITNRAVTKAVEITSEAFAGSVLFAYTNIIKAINELPRESDGVVLESVSFNLVVNAEGKIGLSSTSGKIGAQAGLTFQVRISEKNDAQ